MKMYAIANNEFTIFYQPEISCIDAYTAFSPYIFEKEGYYLGDKFYGDTWLDNCLEYARDEFPEIEWQIFEVKVEQVNE